MTSAERTIERLRTLGQKVTPQRIAIVRYLDGNTAHPTAHRIHQDLLRDHPTLSFTTVYRTLQTLAAIGEILELDVGGDRRHYDPNTRCRVHVVCRACERIEDVTDPDLVVPPPPEWVAAAYGEATAHVQYHGLCAACAGGGLERKSSSETGPVRSRQPTKGGDDHGTEGKEDAR